MRGKNVLVPGKECICLYIKRIIIQLHFKWSSKIDQVGIPYIRKQSICKAVGVLWPQGLKIRLPKEINEYGQSIFCLATIIVFIEMIPVKKFNMLHSNVV